MPGRFEGLSDTQWAVLEKCFPPLPVKRGRGMPPVSRRHALNTILYVAITGCRWCDVPKGKPFASKSSAHRWLKRWQSDGTFEQIKRKLIEMAEGCGKIDWTAACVDGSFSPRQGRRKGRGIWTQGQGGYDPLPRGEERASSLGTRDTCQRRRAAAGLSSVGEGEGSHWKERPAERASQDACRG